MRRAQLLLLVLLLLSGAALLRAADDEADAGHASTSPDGRWEYRLLPAPPQLVEDAPFIVKAGTEEIALALSDAAAEPFLKAARVLWSPDSRRLAFNFRAGGRYNTTVLYQLRPRGRGGVSKWEALRSVESYETTEPIRRALDAEARRLHLSKNIYRRHIWDAWTVRRWLNANTAELYVYSTNTVIVPPDSDNFLELDARFLFTLKFDARGDWRIARTRRVTAEEADKFDAE